jgi:hypothetical protein
MQGRVAVVERGDLGRQDLDLLGERGDRGLLLGERLVRRRAVLVGCGVKLGESVFVGLADELELLRVRPRLLGFDLGCLKLRAV